jgi:hypothetical protein
MKTIIAIMSLVTSLSTVSALASSTVVTCKGKAEYGAVDIKNLVIDQKTIIIQYSVSGGPVLQKAYITTEYFQKNGNTDANQQAYMIGGTKTGAKTDYEDISLPHYGKGRSGLGSEIAFNHEGKRMFGTVLCSQKTR